MISVVHLDGVGWSQARVVPDDVVAITSTVFAGQAESCPPPPSHPAVEATRPHFDLPAERRFYRWSPYLEAVFQDLVARRATGRLTANDRASLNRHRSERQRLKNPLPAEQILYDFKARELRQKAIDALKQYVDFIKASPRSPET